MIDVENELFTIVATELRSQFDGIYVTGEAVTAPSQFPCVVFLEDDNYISQVDMDSSWDEKFAVLRYRVDIYSNKTNGRKSEVKAIRAAIEPLLYRRNFTRFSSTPIDDMGDKIFHVVTTYRVKTDGTSFYRV